MKPFMLHDCPLAYPLTTQKTPLSDLVPTRERSFGLVTKDKAKIRKIYDERFTLHGSYDLLIL